MGRDERKRIRGVRKGRERGIIGVRGREGERQTGTMTFERRERERQGE